MSQMFEEQSRKMLQFCFIRKKIRTFREKEFWDKILVFLQKVPMFYEINFSRKKKSTFLGKNYFFKQNATFIAKKSSF